MIDLCKTYKYDKKKTNADHIINELLNCNKCTITNNNKIDLRYILSQKKDFKINFEITDFNEIEHIYDKYISLEKTKFKKKKNTINIYYILDKDNMYNNCVLIEIFLLNL